MRVALIAVASACVPLTACGGPQTSQANNAQANISNTAQPPATANASATTNPMLMLATAPPKDQALKIMHDRHEAMEGLGKAMKALHRELESGKPDINVVRQQTSNMASTSAKIPGFFPAGTGPDVGKTRAKPEIWKQQDLFLRKAKDFQAAAQVIDAAAKAGDLNKVMASHDAVDKACKACHDPFRAPEH
jgi:cytochrome c556